MIINTIMTEKDYRKFFISHHFQEEKICNSPAGPAHSGPELADQF